MIGTAAAKSLLELAIGDLTPGMKTVLWRVFITAVLVLHIAMSCGLLPFVDGFAYADQVERNSQQVQALAKKVDCNAILGEISRLRSELREARTALFEAEQTENTAFVQHMNDTIAMIENDISDQIERRSTNGCLSI
jgi:hypothetical protein